MTIMLAKRIYIFFIILSFLIGIYFYGIAKDNYTPQFLTFFALLPFYLFIAGVHGLIAHTMKTTVKGNLIIYPIIMGIVFALLFFIHIFIILPLLFPDIF
jgi:hypothetical protein